jgi:hypothetical protein
MEARGQHRCASSRQAAAVERARAGRSQAWPKNHVVEKCHIMRLGGTVPATRSAVEDWRCAWRDSNSRPNAPGFAEVNEVVVGTSVYSPVSVAHEEIARTVKVAMGELRKGTASAACAYDERQRQEITRILQEARGRCPCRSQSCGATISHEEARHRA